MLHNVHAWQRPRTLTPAMHADHARNHAPPRGRQVAKLRHPFIVPHVDSWVVDGHTVNIVSFVAVEVQKAPFWCLLICKDRTRVCACRRREAPRMDWDCALALQLPRRARLRPTGVRLLRKGGPRRAH